MTLTKADLAEQLYIKAGLNHQEGKEMVQTFSKEIAGCLERAKKINLSGFSAFALRDKLEHPGRNPETKKEISVSARRVVPFHASASLKGAVEASRFLLSAAAKAA